MTSLESTTPMQSLPCCRDTEEAVLALMLESPDQIETERLSSDMFYIPAHRKLFSAISEINQSGTCDLVRLNSYLRDKGELESVGGPGAVAQLIANPGFASQFDHYVATLEKKLTHRKIIELATQFSKQAFDEHGGDTDILAELETAVFGLGEEMESGGSGPVAMRDWMLETIGALESYRNGSDNAGLSTGFQKLDWLINGLEPQKLIVVAARPGEGKSAILTNILASVCGSGGSVLAFSAEMSRTEFGERLIQASCQIDGSSLKSGSVTSSDWEGVTEFISTITDESKPWGEFWIDDSPDLTIESIRARARRYRRRHPDLSLIAIDYLQLIRSSSRRARENRQVEVADISRQCKAMAKELGVPVLVAAQLNRNSTNENRPPRLSDLRESGAIEQDADVVAMLHWKNESDKLDEAYMADVDLLVVKCRGGKTGNVPLNFVKSETRFQAPAISTGAGEPF